MSDSGYEFSDVKSGRKKWIKTGIAVLLGAALIVGGILLFPRLTGPNCSRIEKTKAEMQAFQSKLRAEADSLGGLIAQIDSNLTAEGLETKQQLVARRNRCLERLDTVEALILPSIEAAMHPCPGKANGQYVKKIEPLIEEVTK